MSRTTEQPKHKPRISPALQAEKDAVKDVMQDDIRDWVLEASYMDLEEIYVKIFGESAYDRHDFQ